MIYLLPKRKSARSSFCKCLKLASDDLVDYTEAVAECSDNFVLALDGCIKLPAGLEVEYAELNSEFKFAMLEV